MIETGEAFSSVTVESVNRLQLSALENKVFIMPNDSDHFGVCLYS